MGRPKKEAMSETQKLIKAIGSDGEDIVRELEASDTEGLNKRIAQANHAIVDTKAQLEENLAYKKAKEDVAHLSAGLKEVKKRQNAIIKIALELRKDRGEA